MSKHPETVALLGLLALAGFSKSDQLKDLLMRAEARVPENGRNTEFIDELKTWFEESNVHSTLNGAIDGLEPLFVGSKGTSKAVSWMSDQCLCRRPVQQLNFSGYLLREGCQWTKWRKSGI